MLYKHIIQVENKSVGLKVEGHKHTIPPRPNQKSGGHMPPFTPASYASVKVVVVLVVVVVVVVVVVSSSSRSGCRSIDSNESSIQLMV